MMVRWPSPRPNEPSENRTNPRAAEILANPRSRLKGRYRDRGRPASRRIETLSGGYVGVDIFFGISGYLITSTIISELERGDFSMIR
jgi:hypothetical protein